MSFSTEDGRWLGEAGLSSVEAVLAFEPETAMAINRSSETFAVEVAAPGGPPSVFVKRYWHRSKTRRFKQMFRGTLFGAHRARVEFDRLNGMRARGVDAPRPVAWGELRKRGFVRACFLITEGRAATESLDQFALRRATERNSSAARRAVVEGLARAVRGMHDAGVYHGALAWRNILIEAQREDTYRFSFLDPDTRSRFFDGAVPAARADVDLAHLMASAMALDVRVGPSRFMRGYLAVRTLAADQRARLRGVLRKAAAIAEYERRRVAVADTIRALRDHFRNPPSGRQRCRSLDEFFGRLANGDVAAVATGKTVRFVLEDRRSGEAIDHWYVVTDTSVARLERPVGAADLTVEADAVCWLMVVNADRRALRRLRRGEVRPRGDTGLFEVLAKRMRS